MKKRVRATNKEKSANAQNKQLKDTPKSENQLIIWLKINRDHKLDDNFFDSISTQVQ